MAFQNFKSSKKIHFEISYLKTLSQSPSCAVTIYKDFKGKLAILPFHLGYIKQAVKELLDAKVSFYDIELDGIVLGFNNIKVFNSACHTDSPKLFLDYTADVYLFRPTIKCVLKGIVNKKSPEHIGCLVNKAFNASICKPKEEHLIDNWEKMHSTVELGEPITFTVVHIDFSSTLPCINGSFCPSLKTEVKVENDSMSMDDMKNFSGEEENTNFHDPAGISDLLDNCDKSIGGLKKRKILNSEVSANDISLSPPKKKRKKLQIDVPSSDDSENNIFKNPTKNKLRDLQNNNKVSPSKGVIKNEKESEKMFKKKNSNLDVSKSDSNSVNFKRSSDESSDDSGNPLITSTLKKVINSKKVSPKKKELEGISLEEKDSKKALKKKKSSLGVPSKSVLKSTNSQSSTEESLDDSRLSIINSAMEQLNSKKVASESSQEEVRNAGESNKIKKKKSVSVFNSPLNNGRPGKMGESPVRSKKIKQSTEVDAKEVVLDVDVSNLETNESTPLKKKRKKEKSRLSIEDLKNSIIADRICKLSL